MYLLKFKLQLTILKAIFGPISTSYQVYNAIIPNKYKVI